MSRSNEPLIDSLVRLIDAILSVRWSLVHWLMKKAMGEPAVRDFAELALFRTPSMRKQVWTELTNLPGRDLVQLMCNLLPHKNRRKFLKRIKKELGPEIRRALNHPFLQEFKDELERSMPQVAAQYSTDQKPIDERLYPELQCDLNTLLAEPWRAEKAFPMEILKSPKERQRLHHELSPDQNSYGQQLITFIWQLATNPYSLDLPAPRSNDLLYDVVQDRPSDNPTGSQVAKALVKLFEALSEEGKAKAMFDHCMARILRHEFGLSKGRNVSVFSKIEERQKVAQAQAGTEPGDDPWEPEDALSMRGYDDVDWRQQYEALRDKLPDQQKVAVKVYLEKIDTGESIEDICSRQTLNPVTVRNNFQAVKRKVSKGKL